MSIQIAESPGGRWTLTSEVELPASIDDVFAFFSDARNLERITPPWLRFSVVTPLPITMAAGAKIDYRLRLRGIPVSWQSEITVWQPPHRFVDEQRRGPYTFWRHEHAFRDGGSSTVVFDRVDYSAPFGRLVNELFVARDLRRIFTFRSAALSSTFPQHDRELSSIRPGR